MRAITVVPGQRDSVALTDMPEPPDEDGPVLVQAQAIGVCGTDLEIINGDYGSAPPGEDRLIIGHESLGRVVQAAFTPNTSSQSIRSWGSSASCSSRPPWWPRPGITSRRSASARRGHRRRY